MKIDLTRVMVEDPAKALELYTRILGFVKKLDMPAGGARWLTVVLPRGSGDVQPLLEPTGFPAAKTYPKALFEAGLPLSSFGVDESRKEFARMTKLGVVFRAKPRQRDPSRLPPSRTPAGTSSGSIRSELRCSAAR